MSDTKHKHRQYNYTFIRNKRRRKIVLATCYKAQEQDHSYRARINT